MKYRIQSLDRRFSYNDRFEILISFSSPASEAPAILEFNRALQWMIQTWGWSAEVRQYYELVKRQTLWGLLGQNSQLPEICNANWTWSNGFDDLRIYLKTQQELAFFQIAHPVDQK